MLLSAFYVDDQEMRRYKQSGLVQTNPDILKKTNNFSPMASRWRGLGPLQDRFQKDAVSVSGFTALVNV